MYSPFVNLEWKNCNFGGKKTPFFKIPFSYILDCSQTLLYQVIKTHSLEIGQMHLNCVLDIHAVTVILTHFKL